MGAQLILDMKPFFIGELESSISVAADQTALTILNRIKVGRNSIVAATFIVIVCRLL